MGPGAQGRTYNESEGDLEQHGDLQGGDQVPDCLKTAGHSQAWAEAEHEGGSARRKQSTPAIQPGEGTGEGRQRGGFYWSGPFCQRHCLSLKAADVLFYCR